MNANWLADQENQEVIYAICASVIAEIAPDELVILEEIFPTYVEVAQEGEVVIEELGYSKAFAFGGDGTELVTLVLIPFFINFINSLLPVEGIKIWLYQLFGRELPNSSRSISINEDELRRELQRALENEGAIPKELQRSIIDITVNCLMSRPKK